MMKQKHGMATALVAATLLSTAVGVAQEKIGNSSQALTTGRSVVL